MERFAEQDRLEQMNAQKRRLKVAQHAREVERLIQEKREMYEAAMVSIHYLQSTCFPLLSLLTAVQLACSAIGHALPQGCKGEVARLCLCLSMQSHGVQEACQACHRLHYTSRQLPVNKQHSNRILLSQL